MKNIFIFLLAFSFVSCNSQNKNVDKTKEATKEITKKSPLIDWTVLLILLAVSLSTEWFTRKYHGMV